MTAPLRLGILGASRISEQALVEPARTLGHELVAVGVRDRARGEAYAERFGVGRVHTSYAAVLADPDVEVVYNALPNSLHAPWNARALEAGKHVLTEKPSASNAREARAVAALVEQRPGLVFLEGFHYRYHPQWARLLELTTDGSIGRLERLDVTMAMPAPDAADLRWSWELAGGALMDLGCYCLHVARTAAARLGGEPVLRSASARLRAGSTQVDERFDAELTLPGGAIATAHADMASDGWSMTIRAQGSAGSAQVVDFIHPQVDDRLVVVGPDGERVEHTGSRTTYTYQLEAFAAAVRTGDRDVPTGAADAVATMELVDACYERAGLLPRGTVEA